MDSKIKILIGVLVVVIISVCGLWILIQENSITTKTTDLKKACINATIRAIELEIGRCKKWLEIPEEELTEGAKSREEIESRLNQLQIDLEKYKNIQLHDYELPEKIEIIGWVDKPCTENTILQIEDMTRSGPFYHIVGIKGGDYAVIKPKTKYRMTIYLVYPRYYPFPSYYIYIDDYKQIQ